MIGKTVDRLMLFCLIYTAITLSCVVAYLIHRIP